MKNEQQGRFLKLEEASKYLNVSISTLRKWDKDGKLKSIRTVGNHRRWKIEDIQRFIGEEDRSQRNNSEIRVVTYARCSSTE